MVTLATPVLPPPLPSSHSYYSKNSSSLIQIAHSDPAFQHTNPKARAISHPQALTGCLRYSPIPPSEKFSFYKIKINSSIQWPVWISSACSCEKATKHPCSTYTFFFLPFQSVLETRWTSLKAYPPASGQHQLVPICTAFVCSAFR